MQQLEYTFDAIGTRWHLQLLAPDDLVADDLLDAVRNRIDEYDKNYSRFRADSLVTKMSQEKGVFTMPSDVQPLMRVYYDLYRLTGGAFTPLIGAVLEQAGYDASYSLQVKKLETPPTWEEVIRYDGARTVEMLQPAILDFGAGGKGYLVDIIAALVESYGVTSYCIDAGGDIMQRNTLNKSIAIGLENPLDTSEAIGVVNLLNASICGSAGNRRAWKEFHHIIDPRTLASPRDIAATWVVANTTLVVDALATALFFVPAHVLRATYEFEYVILYANGGASVSSAFPGEVFTA